MIRKVHHVQNDVRSSIYNLHLLTAITFITENIEIFQTNSEVHAVHVRPNIIHPD